MMPLIDLLNLLLRHELSAIAPPKSYPNKKVLFFWLNLNILKISSIKSIGYYFSENFSDLEVNLLPYDSPNPGKSTEYILQLIFFNKKET
jgi:hypothetical protein